MSKKLLTMATMAALTGLASTAKAGEPNIIDSVTGAQHQDTQVVMLTDIQMDGITAGTTVRLYEDAGFQGSQLVSTKSVKNLLTWYNPPFGNWNDETSSLKIAGGSVTFYQNINYGGASWKLTPGDYDQGRMLAKGIPNDSISSFKL